MSEPTIYKPSIYKGAGIYKNGAAGGGGGQDLSKQSLRGGGFTINNLVADGFNGSNYFLTNGNLTNNKTYEYGISYKLKSDRTSIVALIGGSHYDTSFCVNIEKYNSNECNINVIYPSGYVEESKILIGESLIGKWFFVRATVEPTRFRIEFTKDFRNWITSAWVSYNSSLNGDWTLGRLGSSDTYSPHAYIDLKNTYLKENGSLVYGMYSGVIESV